MIEEYGVNDEQHIWLGLDPGVTTGWAIIGPRGKVLGLGDFKIEVLRDGLDELIRGVHRSDATIDVVIEKIPRAGGVGQLAGKMNTVLGIIHEVIDEVFELPVTEVLPGEWKPSRVAKEERDWPDKTSRHAKDAALMTLYARSKSRRRNG